MRLQSVLKALIFLATLPLTAPGFVGWVGYAYILEDLEGDAQISYGYPGMVWRGWLFLVGFIPALLFLLVSELFRKEKPRLCSGCSHRKESHQHEYAPARFENGPCKEEGCACPHAFESYADGCQRFGVTSVFTH